MKNTERLIEILGLIGIPLLGSTLLINLLALNIAPYVGLSILFGISTIIKTKKWSTYTKLLVIILALFIFNITPYFRPGDYTIFAGGAVLFGCINQSPNSLGLGWPAAYVKYSLERGTILVGSSSLKSNCEYKKIDTGTFFPQNPQWLIFDVLFSLSWLPLFYSIFKGGSNTKLIYFLLSPLFIIVLIKTIFLFHIL